MTKELERTNRIGTALKWGDHQVIVVQTDGHY
jgi:hypothetical protein